MLVVHRGTPLYVFSQHVANADSDNHSIT